jgi:hypothetical protein
LNLEEKVLAGQPSLVKIKSKVKVEFCQSTNEETRILKMNLYGTGYIYQLGYSADEVPSRES